MNSSLELTSLSFYKKLIHSFLSKDEFIDTLINEHFDLDKIEKNIEEKFLSPAVRNILADDLAVQYKNLSTNSTVTNNINLLRDSRTFTVTTGHQLNLFTGPLYSLIKICQTIALAKKLKKKYPGYNFIPIYWMATEDHDIEEINHFNLFGKKFSWESSVEGPSGEVSTSEIIKLQPELEELFKNSEETAALVKDIFEIYKLSNNLAEAHRTLIHKLIPDEGLVILDANSKTLKSIFSELAIKEVGEQVCFSEMTKTNEKLKNEGFHIQINPRDICLFYQRENYRVRLTSSETGFKTADDKYTWQKSELLKEIKSDPERFSPNACMRPVYQEQILPNLAYIGGPGEISYWLQLKSTFEKFKIDFPILILRNSYLFMSQKQVKTLEDAELEISELFDQSERVLARVNSKSLEIDFDSYNQRIENVLGELSTELLNNNLNVEAQVAAANQNIHKQLSNLSKKVLNLSKTKNETKLKRIEKLVEDVYPNQVLKERKNNFLELLNTYALEELIERLTSEERLSKPSLIIEVK